MSNRLSRQRAYAFMIRSAEEQVVAGEKSKLLVIISQCVPMINLEADPENAKALLQPSGRVRLRI